LLDFDSGNHRQNRDGDNERQVDHSPDFASPSITIEGTIKVPEFVENRIGDRGKNPSDWRSQKFEDRQSEPKRPANQFDDKVYKFFKHGAVPLIL
jgi:hypothetical protein